MGKIRTGAVAVVVALVSALVGAAPALAAETARISRTILLASTSTGSAALPAGDGKLIRLAAGRYEWKHRIAGLEDPGNRMITLAAGEYRWSCDLVGTGLSPVNYSTVCRLDPQAAGRATAFLPADGRTYWQIPAGNRTWTSELDPQF
ncbi:hypothetical protein Q5530_16805 [Saccharothrix sp. BKS2]|uniref:hypothetical protein n=1 Tax=Saccharothrix sp. BKS2 TaxID=3064400 RepID=UPI0039ECE97F